MKSQKVLAFLVTLLISLQICEAQEKTEALLIDEFDKLCSEEVMARYDSFLGELGNNPSAMGYFVFYGDAQREGGNLNFIAFLKDIYPDSRRFDKTRLAVVRGANRPQMHVQFWVVPPGAEAPTPEKEFLREKINSTKIFDKNWADFYKDYGGTTEIYSSSFLELGCEFAPNVREFAKILLADAELTGYLVVYTKFGKGAKRGNQVAAFAVNDLVKNYKAPRSRLRTIYGGSREKPELELWLVPKGDKPPVPKPESKPIK
jgi:hypothetical protein